MPKKKDTETQMDAQQPKKPMGSDAVVTIAVETADGTETRKFRVQGFRGNTLAWQRSGKGLDQMLMPGLLRAFGGQITPE